ncbi:MAG: amino acid adenylation domain-containing protein [Muribaculaceae bacterium]|nr:amino acid adenylation domain-containing protein [Muribaculaceae bacterium]
MSKATIYSRFKEIAEKFPDSVAIYQDDRTLTFSELDGLVNAVLTKIDSLSENPGEFIGIVMHHGYMQIAAMLAVLKSGAAYVPAEPTLPADRINYMMRNAGVTLVIDDDFCDSLNPEAKDLPDKSTPEGIAYVLYTSGTTGKPKGVVIENHSVANYARAFEAEMKIGPGDVMLQYSICSFDIFVEEVFATLLNGAALAIPSGEIHNGPIEGLMDFCRRHKVTILDGFPYLVADINHRPELLPPSVTLIVSGGDVVRENYISYLRDKGVRIYNTYGPSETCVCSNYYRIDNAPALEDGTYPVGKPVEGVDVKIMDENLREVGDGVFGEICIFGEGVGRGYLGNPPEQSNFITLPDGTRFYRSGDMGFRREDGNVIFLHRRDDQVMILGRRVEPEEVENVLNEYPDIDRGIVRAFKDEAGLHYLVAYIIPEVGFALSGLKDWLKSKLADFMVPEFYVALHAIPLNSHGKVDMAQLPVVLKEGDYK